MPATKPFIAILAAAIIGVGAATAAVPTAERAGTSVPARSTEPGIQLADGCGNWGPNQRNSENDCLIRSWQPDPDWIVRGEPGSQDDDFPTGRDISRGQDDDDDHVPPCFC